VVGDDNDSEDVYEAEKILDFVVSSGRRPYLYLVKWKGYPNEEATWEPPAHLLHAPVIVKEYHDAHPNKRKPPEFAGAHHTRRGG
jgi:hypothetical protein